MSKLLRAARTFESVTCEWYQRYATSLSTSNAKRILAYLVNYLFPYIGQHSIDVITPDELLTVLRWIAIRSPETAKRVMGACNRVFVYAFQAGLIDSNPVDVLRGTLPPIDRKPATAPDPEAIGTILNAIDGYDGSPIIKAAMQLAPIMIVRPKELLHAEWAEMDLSGQQWVIPAEKNMRMSPHVVPFSSQANDILQELHNLTGNSNYVFASRNSTHIAASSIRAALRKIGYPMPLYSFRRMGVTVLYLIGVNPDLIEIQLNCKGSVPSKFSVMHTLCLPKRREMMQRLADYLDTLKGRES